MTHPIQQDTLIVVGSRGQPEAVAELAQSWASVGRLVICVDNTDPTMPTYVQACTDLGVEIFVGPPRPRPLTVRDVAARYTDSYTTVIVRDDAQQPPN